MKQNVYQNTDGKLLADFQRVEEEEKTEAVSGMSKDFDTHNTHTFVVAIFVLMETACISSSTAQWTLEYTRNK